MPATGQVARYTREGGQFGCQALRMPLKLGQRVRPNGHVRVTTSVPAPLAAALERRAADCGMTPSEFVRTLIRSHIDPKGENT